MTFNYFLNFIFSAIFSPDTIFHPFLPSQSLSLPHDRHILLCIFLLQIFPPSFCPSPALAIPLSTTSLQPLREPLFLIPCVTPKGGGCWCPPYSILSLPFPQWAPRGSHHWRFLWSLPPHHFHFWIAFMSMSIPAIIPMRGTSTCMALPVLWTKSLASSQAQF